MVGVSNDVAKFAKMPTSGVAATWIPTVGLTASIVRLPESSALTPGVDGKWSSTLKRKRS